MLTSKPQRIDQPRAAKLFKAWRKSLRVSQATGVPSGNQVSQRNKPVLASQGKLNRVRGSARNKTLLACAKRSKPVKAFKAWRSNTGKAVLSAWSFSIKVPAMPTPLYKARSAAAFKSVLLRKAPWRSHQVKRMRSKPAASIRRVRSV